MTPVKPAAPPPSRSGRWLWLFLLLLGAATMTVAWASLALASGRQSGWMALLAGLQAAWMLRLGGMRPGWPRALLAAATTALVTVAVQWLVASGHIGGQMGMPPWEAAPRMGAGYVWTLSKLANSRLDLLCLALAPLLALRLGR
ncbi:hypothetical protein [Pseudoxanthomonas sp.]|uniref:hypothetical protein n=1 Tax=Pseudoxanthomonas sp. TaxID=1871049 RepID=UPI0025885A71|nr:hypothetical protein [Pseudoxanthomonas sp.]MCR6686260.1 hypothetical protein [Pseudoxanthomonas sp.]